MIHSLQQRLGFFLLLPVTLLLLGLGLFGFFSIRNSLLQAWEEAALLKLERAAHTIDMRLSRVKSLIQEFHNMAEAEQGHVIQPWLLQQMETEEGVSRVTLTWLQETPPTAIMPMMPGDTHIMGRGMAMGRTPGKREMMHFYHARIAEVTPPLYDSQAGQETLSLVSYLLDETGRTVGTLEVIIRFDYLIAGILTNGWKGSTLAGLVDGSGRYLAHTNPLLKGRQLGETNAPLEMATLTVLKTQRSGTLLGTGHPPEWVSGFYRLQEAPWTVVLFAPGGVILAPITRFLSYYVLAGLLGMGGILFVIRSVVGRMVAAVQELSQAAAQIAQDHYGPPLPVRSQDEIGQLTRSFNTMVEGLKERDFLSNTFGRYVDREIARELLRRPEAARLGGEKREVAILISDLRRFTPLAESLSPEATLGLLNRYFGAMIAIVQKHQGIIVDFFGDGMLVFFDPLDGAVVPRAHQALRCAMEMQNTLVHFNTERREEQFPELQMGIGLNAGEVVVGNIGSETRAKYGIVGAAVNVTQRIQSIAQGGEVVISESVYRYTQGQLIIKDTVRVSLKGVQEPVTLYKVGGLTEGTGHPAPR